MIALLIYGLLRLQVTITPEIPLQFKLESKSEAINGNSITPSLAKSVKWEKANLDVCKFYIQDISLIKNHVTLYKDEKHHLIDILSGQTDSSLLFPSEAIQNADSIRFWVGVDSITSVSGVMGGDLDPLLGMYWTWQSGYIFLKMEGTVLQGKNPAKTFEYHLGGFHHPHSAYTCISLACPKSWNGKIELDAEHFIQSALNNQKERIMSPGFQAHQLMQELQKCFSATK